MNSQEFRKQLECLGRILPQHIVKELCDNFDQLQKQFLEWSIEDFEQVAIEESGENWEKVYDKSQFQSALEKMISEHDAMNGINWDDVSYYLNEFCKKD